MITLDKTNEAHTARIDGPVFRPAVHPTESDLPGIWVGKIAIPGPYAAAELTLNANHSYQVRVAGIDSGPSLTFTGTWSYENGVLQGEHFVPELGKVTITANLNGHTITSLEKQGSEATIAMGPLGEVPFNIRKTDEPFF